MLATDEETLLMGFLDETVACEMTKEHDHDAVIYIQFSCTKCAWQNIWASCNPCWVRYLSRCTPDTTLMCNKCFGLNPVDSVVNLGPIR